MPSYVLITDRGGHLHNALMLVEQIGISPDSIITTQGPDIDALKKNNTKIYTVPYLFTWLDKRRIFNPISFVFHVLQSLFLVFKTRPRKVVSLGASNVVVFCYLAKLFGADIYHVECMNQVKTKSITAKLLYPICKNVFVQWKELLPQFGAKAVYAGWVL